MLTAIGVGEVVASMAPVPDTRETMDIMVALHKLLS
jgi:hypothetical protein